MRIPGQWAFSEEGYDDAGADEPAWLAIGFITSELGGLVMLIAIVLAGLGARRVARGGGSGLTRAAGVLSVVLVAMYLVTFWAMTTKPA